MLRTVFALLISTGLVACVTDDSTVDTEELAENPDVFADPEGNQIDPSGVKENPGDAPGMIPAPNQGGNHVNVPNTTTTDLGLNRQDERYDSVVVGDSTEDVNLVRGKFETTQVGGQEVGFSCDGQDMNCRAMNPAKKTY
jgi:hypothetical protein